MLPLIWCYSFCYLLCCAIATSINPRYFSTYLLTFPCSPFTPAIFCFSLARFLPCLQAMLQFATSLFAFLVERISRNMAHRGINHLPARFLHSCFLDYCLLSSIDFLSWWFLIPRFLAYLVPSILTICLFGFLLAHKRTSSNLLVSCLPASYLWYFIRSQFFASLHLSILAFYLLVLLLSYLHVFFLSACIFPRLVGSKHFWIFLPPF